MSDRYSSEMAKYAVKPLIRLALPSDIQAVMTLVQRVVPAMREEGNLQWDEGYPNREVFKSDIANGDLWVAEVDGTVAAVAAITGEQSPEYAEVGWDLDEEAVVVHRLAVDPGYRGLGLAARLMQQAETVAGVRKTKVLRVDTNTRNLATQRLFPNLGYRLAGEISLRFREGLRFYCYEKRLG